MQKRSSIIRQSLSTKMSLWLVAFVAVMLVAALFVMFMYARRAVKAEALAIAIADAEIALNADEPTVETLAAAKEALIQSISEFNNANLEAEPLFA